RNFKDFSFRRAAYDCSSEFSSFVFPVQKHRLLPQKVRTQIVELPFHFPWPKSRTAFPNGADLPPYRVFEGRMHTLARLTKEDKRYTFNLFNGLGPLLCPTLLTTFIKGDNFSGIRPSEQGNVERWRLSLRRLLACRQGHKQRQG